MSVGNIINLFVCLSSYWSGPSHSIFLFEGEKKTKTKTKTKSEEHQRQYASTNPAQEKDGNR